MTAPQTSSDAEHLKLLSIFHYVLAGLTALSALFPLLYVLLGVLMATGAMEERHRDGSERAFGWVFAAFGCLFVMGIFALAAALVFAGRSLAQRKRHTFCIVVAGVSCLFFPFGTALGVFTLIVLMRPSVKELFASPTAVKS